MSNLVEHLENHLGPIEAGWSQDADAQPMPFQVVRFRDAPIAGCRTFSTLGLSNHSLRSRISEKMIRHELVFLTHRSCGDMTVPGLLQQAGSEALTRKTAYLRGDVIGPRGPLFPGSKLEALYVAVPVYFPDSFSIVETNCGVIVLAWLVPISRNEAEYIQRAGWQAFEDALLRYDPDLVDFSRSGLDI